MPLTVNVGLNRKHSKNFQSSGTSINITAELDQSLLANSQKLQDEIAGLYHQAENALTRQALRERQYAQAINALPAASTSSLANSPAQASSSSASPASASEPPRRATRNQLRALHRIAQELEIDLDAACIQAVGRRWDILDLREASRMIDLLRARQQRQGQDPASNPSHNGVQHAEPAV
jgi:hypothetical protein